MDVVPSKFEENLDKESFTHPWQYAVENSKLKALDVAQRLQVTTAVCGVFIILPHCAQGSKGLGCHSWCRYCGGEYYITWVDFFYIQRGFTQLSCIECHVVPHIVVLL